MVQITKYVEMANQSNDHTPTPFINSIFVNLNTLYVQTGEEHGFKTFMKWARRSPELMGLINIIATDILSDKIEFKPLEGDKRSGRNRILKAKEFWNVNAGLEVMEQTIYDELLAGIGYNWVGKVKESEMREYARLIAKESFPKLNGRELQFRENQTYEMIARGEVSSLAKKFRHIPASTVKIVSDMHEPKAYVQQVGPNKKVFSTEEVLVYKLMPFDGKIYPFPPMECILAEVYLLWLINQNYISYFENGGHPDKVFVLPNELANSRNHTYLVETLKKYKKIENKHGNLVFTGDLKIEDLMNAESQMEHKDLGLYLVGLLAMFYGIPVGRIPFLIGKAANNGDAGGLADSGYWRKISVWQSKIENTINSGLWRPYFGVEMKFSRGYMQDEVRETQNDINRTSVAEQRLRLGLWTVEDAAEYCGIDPEEVGEAQAQKEERDAKQMQMQTGMKGQLADNNGNVMKEPDKRAADKRRQDTQNNKQTAAGGKKINP